MFCKQNPIKFLKTQSQLVSTSNFSISLSKGQEFKRLELITKRQTRGRPKRDPKNTALNTEFSESRYKQMPINQNWMDVWPTAQNFRPSVVPLPLFQGYVTKGAPPHKFSNPELMKIPNFLHLTPPAIDAHCDALKRFCTPWPEALKTDEDVQKHFPVEVISNDLIYTGPSLRESRARVVVLNINLSDLNLDYRSRDKFLRLVGDKYNPTTDIVTIVGDRCPMRKQNYDYAMYVLTALYHESKKKEDWEDEKTEQDMEAFFFEKSRSERKACRTLQSVHGLTEAEASTSPLLKNYGEGVARLINEGDDDEALEAYKKSVLAILGLKQNRYIKPVEE